MNIKKFIIFFVLALAVVLILAASYKTFRKSPAGLKVESDLVSFVFVNDKEVGKTPFEGTFAEGDVRLKVIPQVSKAPLVAYERSVVLTGGTKTIVRRYFDESSGVSSGEIIFLEKGLSSSLIVSSTPLEAEISVDGTKVGSSPFSLTLPSGQHEVSLHKENYQDVSLQVSILEDYAVYVIADLLKLPK